MVIATGVQPSRGRRGLLVAVTLLLIAGGGYGLYKTGISTQWSDPGSTGNGLYAVLKTNHGTMVLELFYDKVPRTVENFVGLATGAKEWTDPKTREKVRRPLYDGLTFHRIIPRFMIQGGCPLGDGRGGPGYRFPDEIVSGLSFDRAGVLAMANAGPNTNGCQFFITLAPTRHLRGRHTIFGRVARGRDVLRAIGQVQTGARDKPVQDVRIESLTIDPVGRSADVFYGKVTGRASPARAREGEDR